MSNKTFPSQVVFLVVFIYTIRGDNLYHVGDNLVKEGKGEGFNGSGRTERMWVYIKLWKNKINAIQEIEIVHPHNSLPGLDLPCYRKWKLRLWGILFIFAQKNRTTNKNLMKISSQEKIQPLICYMRNSQYNWWQTQIQRRKFLWVPSLSNKYCKNLIYFDFCNFR